MTHFRVGIDASSIERTVRESLRGLDETLEGLRDLHQWRERDVEIDETVEVGAGAELVITTLQGDVKVRGADGNRIRIKAEGESPLPDAPRVERHGNQVTFNVPPGAEVDVEAVVPRDCRIRVSTGEGDVEIENTGAIEIRTMDGDVTADGVAGDCNVTTGQGDVTLERVAGELTLHTISGDLEVSESRVRRAEVHSVDGELTLDAALGEGPFSLQTVNGDINLLLPHGTGATVAFHTANGEVSCDMPAQVTMSSKREWHAQINDGGASVDIQTVNGDLEIEEGHGVAADTPRYSAPVPPVPPSPALAAVPTMPPTPPSAADPDREDTSEVLQALERGEISVDEAMERLSGVE